MNRDFLEFWGNFLLQAARGQRQLEELAKWTRVGFEAIEEQKAFWSALLYAQKESGEEPKAVETWEQSMDEFRESYREFMKIFGLVSMDEYQELIKKNEALEKKLAEQRKALPKGQPSVKKILDVQREMEEGLQGLVEKQSEQFKELMESIRTFYGSGLPDR